MNTSNSSRTTRDQNFVLSSTLSLGLPKRFFPVKVLKALLPSFIVAKCPAHLNLLDLIALAVLYEGERIEDKLRDEDFRPQS